jgi:acetyl esterase/lipase
MSSLRLIAAFAILKLAALHAAPPSGSRPIEKGAPALPPDQARVGYGQDPVQIMDVWLAKSDQPTPAVVYIHGGAWEGGSRQSIQSRGLTRLLEAGITVVAIDYRLITPAIKAGITPPIQWPMRDAARAIQFLRSKAAEWNIDKTRFGLTGGSAGACTSLWLSMHEEMAEPQSADPVSRESTRVSCAGVWDAQTSLDPQQLFAWFKAPTYGAHAFGIVKDKNGRWTSDMERCLAQRETLLPWIKEYSPIEHASAGDPPVFLSYSASPQPADQPQLDSVHGAAFGLHLKKRLDTLGVECHWAHPVSPEDPNAPHIEFLIQKLTGMQDSKSATQSCKSLAPLGYGHYELAKGY